MVGDGGQSPYIKQCLGKMGLSDGPTRNATKFPFLHCQINSVCASGMSLLFIHSGDLIKKKLFDFILSTSSIWSILSI